MNLPKSLFITGTDTGVGKTVVTAAISSSIKSTGKNVAVMKPIQTGTTSQEILDIEFTYRVLEENYDINLACPYRFNKPLSPKLASKISGTDIDINYILSAFGALNEKYDLVIVEGAGGILVPIKKNYFISDLIIDMKTPIVIVSRPDLGMINHTLLTIELARKMGITILGIIINNYPLQPDEAELTNPYEISDLSGLPILGIIPKMNNLCVEKGVISSIKENSKKYLCGLFGGNFEWAHEYSFSK